MKRATWVLMATIALAGCSGAGEEPASDQKDVFVAFAADFKGFRSWQAFDVTEDADLVGIHDGSTVMEYVNAMPPAGSESFPVGTIIVKEATVGTLAHEMFAMVNRGGGYNSGAPGWEWFELESTGAEDVVIVWRGVGPPSGENYGGDPNAGCNTCHVDCGNDAVCAKALAL